MTIEKKLPVLSDIQAARKILRGVVHLTPICESSSISYMAGMKILFKCENLQRCGSFKIRGAYTKLSSLGPEERKKGVAAYSSGNHAGQGTLGLEILEQVPDAKRIVVPIGGGGLISGISIAVKSIKKEVEIVGVEPELAPKMSRSLEAGEIVKTVPGETVADGLKPVSPGKLTFEAVKRYVDRVVTVKDKDIIMATKLIMERAKLVVEPSGAVPLAACLSKAVENNKEKTVLVISGGNIDFEMFFKRKEEGHEGR
ncbi:MAG TPA: pyridoxal-phosphate dependent enzyme [Thermoplasmata archaeon]|nr:pyridoxal-phosphate dependent enzyme [Thermoplasmata archaeon]